MSLQAQSNVARTSGRVGSALKRSIEIRLVPRNPSALSPGRQPPLLQLKPKASPVKYLAIPIHSILPSNGKPVSVQLVLSANPCPPAALKKVRSEQRAVPTPPIQPVQVIDGPGMASAEEMSADPLFCHVQRCEPLEVDEQQQTQEDDSYMDKIEREMEDKINFDELAELEENLDHSGLPELYHSFPLIQANLDFSFGTVLKRSADGMSVPSKGVPAETGPKRFRCTVPGCGKTFDRQRSLKYHSITHAPPIYACPRCKKAFVTMPKLKRHMLIHDGVRPFRCAEPGCGKSFTTNSNLNVHKRQHTGEKPFACSVCGRQFAHHSHAKAHLKIHERRSDYRFYTRPSAPNWT